MLFIVVLFIAAIAVMGLFGSDNRKKVLEDFCKVECKQDIKRQYRFCC